MTVRWNSVGGDKISVYLNYSNGGMCYITSVDSSNRDWTFIPSGFNCSQISKQVTSGKYKVSLFLHKTGEVSTDIGVANDSSDNYFTITSATTISAPVITISASPTTVTAGSPSTITWSSTHASSCQGSLGWYGQKPLSSSGVTVNPYSTTSYGIKCTNSSGTSSKSVTVNVGAVTSAPTVTISAEKTSITSGDSTILTWSSTHDESTSCTASGDWSGIKGVAGAKGVGPLTSSKTYTLTCTSTSGTASDSVTVNVSASSTPLPDLIIEKLGTWPTTVKSGTKPGFLFVEKNIGQATGPAGVVRMMVNGAYQAGSWPSATLSPGASTGSILFGYQNFTSPPTDNDWWIPNCQTGDKYTLTMCADNCTYGGSEIRESNEENNRLDYKVTCDNTVAVNSISKSSLSANVLSALNNANNKNNSQTNLDIKSCGEFTMTLSMGMKNSQVKCLQKTLNKKGFEIRGVEKGGETNYFGPATFSALKAFQIAKQLVVDGIFGPNSRTALKK